MVPRRADKDFIIQAQAALQAKTSLQFTLETLFPPGLEIEVAAYMSYARTKQTCSNIQSFSTDLYSHLFLSAQARGNLDAKRCQEPKI